MNDKQSVSDYTHEQLVKANRDFLIAYAMLGMDLIAESLSDDGISDDVGDAYMDGYMDAYGDIGRLLFASYSIDMDQLNGG